MTMPRQAPTSPLITLADRLRLAPGLQLRAGRETPDGFEALVVDPATGQLALMTLSPVNAGTCVGGCGHVAHQDQEQCEAISFVTKRRCECRPFHGRFPRPNDDELRDTQTERAAEDEQAAYERAHGDSPEWV